MQPIFYDHNNEARIINRNL